jgi:hypothetical protein
MGIQQGYDVNNPHVCISDVNKVFFTIFCDLTNLIMLGVCIFDSIIHIPQKCFENFV